MRTRQAQPYNLFERDPSFKRPRVEQKFPIVRIVAFDEIDPDLAGYGFETGISPIETGAVSHGHSCLSGAHGQEMNCVQALQNHQSRAKRKSPSGSVRRADLCRRAARALPRTGYVLTEQRASR